MQLHLGLPTSQTSVGWSGAASRAVDGRTNGIWSQSTCTHSANTGENHWQVDLLDKKSVSKVVIHNRRDCCQERIDGAQVFVGKTLCGSVTYVNGQSVYVVDCGSPIVGEIVKVSLDGDYLTLCEVEILGVDSDDGDGANLVTSTTVSVSQSSTGWSGVASRAVDGNTDGNYWGNSCTHSSSASNNWWSVDLDAVSKINRVVIYGRTDCCQERMANALVYAGDEFCGSVTYTAGQSIFSVDCNGAVAGSVRIEQKYNYLTLCEVNIFGEPTDEAPLVNLASGRGLPTSQTSVGWSGAASRAVDGNSNGIWNSATCTHSVDMGNNHWQVDLLDKKSVSKVVIHNRRDCCQERIDGAQVFVGKTLCGTVTYEIGQSVYVVDCGSPIVGEIVKVSLDGDYLTLCEVEILGVDSDDGDGANLEEEDYLQLWLMQLWLIESMSHSCMHLWLIDSMSHSCMSHSCSSCSCSASTSNNWWEVSLDTVSKINRIVIYGRTDCCQDRMSGALVYAGDEFCGSVTYTAGESIFSVECNGAVAGSVRIEQNYNYLTLCEVKVIGEPTDEAPLVNLASGRGLPTSQTSVGWSGAATRAVDGRSNGIWSQSTCTHSANTGENHWQVDLLDKKSVSKVVIHNRRDCCQERIDGAQVFVGKTLCGSVTYVNGQSVYVVDCGSPIVGEIVKVSLDGDYLTLCEVEILGSETVNGVNLIASSLTASQSSTGWNGVASRAIDGNANGDYWNHTCTHTSSASNNWWEVSLGAVSKIHRVVIYGRTDCCSECGGLCINELIAMELLLNYNYLTLCEVNVFGEPTEETPMVNLARGMPTSQTSEGWNGNPARAVDGKTNGIWSQWIFWIKSQSVKWLFTTGETAAKKESMELSTLTFRDIKHFQVFVGKTLCGSVTYVNGQSVYVVDCGSPIFGEIVKVSLDGDYLTLCEVEILGTETVNGVNLIASSLTASQSSTGWNGVASRAIDGNANGDYWNHASNNWWEVSLSAVSKIHRVVIYGRTDCCQNRMANAQVYAGEEFCGSIAYTTGDVFTVDCNGAVAGSVRIEQNYNYLTLCEVNVFGEPTEETPMVNLARGMPTSQTSEGWNGNPARAVDGKTNGIWSQSTCTHSANGASNFWTVNLLGKKSVSKVVIHNRRDCCQSRLNGAQGGPLSGSNVKILKEGDYLTLCEVQVLGVEKKNNFVNVALEGKATQDTTGWSGVASRAIDGNTDGDYWGKEDCCENRIDNTKVYLDGELCGRVNYIAGQTVYKISCANTDASSNGSVIRIESNSGRTNRIRKYWSLIDQSRDLIITSSDWLFTCVGSLNPSGTLVTRCLPFRWSSATCTHTAATTGNWWMVDLEDNFLVEKIKITNRGDCCRDRIDGAKVYVGDELCGTIEYSGLKNTYTLDCGMVGSFVRIVNDNSYLTLCEVRVMGDPTPVDAGCANTDASSNGSVIRIESNSGTGTNRIRKYWSLIDQSRDLIITSSDWLFTCVGSLNPSGTLVTRCLPFRWSSATCTHTAATTGNWWMVDLEDNFLVEKIKITNRGDCCRDRIDGAKVYVGDELCGTIEYSGLKNTYTLDCGMVGSFVRIVNDNSYLTLCEVRVMGDPTPVDTETEETIVDIGEMSCGSDDCLSTASCPTGYATTRCVVATGSVGSKSDGAYIENNNCYAANSYLGSGVIAKATCALNPQVQNPCGGEALLKYTSENQYGEGVSLSCPAGYEEQSCGLHCPWVDQISSKGVSDEGELMGETCAVSGCSKWCRLSIVCKLADLEQYAAANCPTCEGYTCGEGEECEMDTLKVRQVYVGDELCGTIEYSGLKNTYTLDCGMVGSFVRIVNDNSYLTLCEVRVMGDPTPVDTETEETIVDIGEMSCGSDDCLSTASCPTGYATTRCVVATGSVGSKSDGAYIENNNCYAANSYLGSGVIAKATCALNPQVQNPCGGEALLKYTSENQYGEGVSLSCPAGYEEQSCGLHCPWVDQISSKGVSDEGELMGETCAVSGCSKWCRLSIVCKLADLEQYAAANCPTCEGYTCGEGEECEMEDGAPACKEVQLGCVDNERLYTCNCNSTFEFNALTGTCLPIHTLWETVIGEAAIGDDAVSTAECPDGQSVMRCYTFGAPTAADGVYVEGHGSECVARASHVQSYPVRAVAYCGGRTQIRDPCTGDDIYSTEYRINSSQSPSIQCPGGYIMSSCSFHSPWTSSSHLGLRLPHCAIENCMAGDSDYWCKLTAICTKLTGWDNYMRSACPSCDDVRCDDGFECTLGTDNSLPQCTEVVPGGCDVDNCGRGECIENGTQYTCSCESGFSFNGETCEDIDECAQSPCGNGECENVEGSYECDCMDGYTVGQGTCVDINECLDESTCGELERCSNVEGSYICDCLQAFYRDGTSESVH
eukprot:sb/3460492/